MTTYSDKLNMLRKQAGVKDLLNPLTDLFDKYAIPAWKTVRDSAMVTIPAVGIGGAYALSKITSPTHIAGSADKELYLNTLKTEVAAARRQLAAMEIEDRLEGEGRKVFDKFLG